AFARTYLRPQNISPPKEQRLDQSASFFAIYTLRQRFVIIFPFCEPCSIGSIPVTRLLRFQGFGVLGPDSFTNRIQQSLNRLGYRIGPLDSTSVVLANRAEGLQQLLLFSRAL